MVQNSLSQPALAVIQSYLHLPIPGHDISCPYYNNRRQHVRGALRVMVGKGSVKDIVGETKILLLKEKLDLNKLSDEQLKQFLVDRHVGTDCSALAYYVLDAELRAQKKSGLRTHVRWQNGNPWRRLMRKLRPVENTNVDTLADDRNSIRVELKDIQSGDLIIMQGFGPNHDRDHVLVVHQTEPLLRKEGYTPPKAEGGVVDSMVVHYTHALQWLSDGKYNHGVRQGKIEIVDTHKSLLDQLWTEQNVTGESNETWRHAKDAGRLEIRRLRALQ